jgi:hypothetical protein
LRVFDMTRTLEPRTNCVAALAVNKLLLISVALLVPSSCRDAAPDAPTAEEAEQLNEAEDLLNAQAEGTGPTKSE